MLTRNVRFYFHTRSSAELGLYLLFQNMFFDINLYGDGKFNIGMPVPPKSIQCASCGSTMVAFESLSPEPPDRDDCPFCGGTEFKFV